jgi:CubicO group peptidase (beta-lactamase class C family)
MEEAAREVGYSGTVIVTKGGEPLLRAAYGEANRELGVPNRPETKMRLGSVTKQFTAMAVLILAEQGKLKLDDRIVEKVDFAPAAWKDITVRHLLNHTSGIPNFTDFPDYMPKRTWPQTHEEMVARFRDKPLEFEPGSRFNYSNSGYFLLGIIIEKASGQKYEDFLEEAILGPVGMADTGYDWSREILPGRAAGYELGPDGPVNAAPIDMGQPFAAGALYSTVDDLAKWDRALAGKKLISKESYAEMFKPAHDGYAFGWAVAEKDGRLEQSHGGGIDGFNSLVVRFPEEDLFLAFLSNLVPARLNLLSKSLAAIARGEEPERPWAFEPAKIDPAVYDGYVGRYAVAPEFVVTVSRDGDRLFVQAPEQPKFELMPASETEFVLKGVEARMVFRKVEEGKAGEAVLLQGGREMPAPRVEE